MLEVHILFVYYFLVSKCDSGGGRVVANIWNQYCDKIKRPDKKVAVRKLDLNNPYNLYELWKKTDFLKGLKELSVFAASENIDYGIQEIRNVYDFVLPDFISTKIELENLESGIFGPFYEYDKTLFVPEIEDSPVSAQHMILRDLRRCIFMKELLLRL